jgi:hypothetical protein
VIVYFYAMFGIAHQLRSTKVFCRNSEETRCANPKCSPDNEFRQENHISVLSISSINFFPSIYIFYEQLK